jgi:hypothetical protein
MFKAQRLFGTVGAIALIGSLWFARFGWGVKIESRDPIKVWQAVIVIGWLLVPPIYFWIEYFWLYKKSTAPGKPDLETFKYGQDVSSKIWIAATSALLALYFWKDFRG